tara:strand:+ start:283 stop:507 length:225 start_codon:yes stop_codon:yes gene_type:complete
VVSFFLIVLLYHLQVFVVTLLALFFLEVFSFLNNPYVFVVFVLDYLNICLFFLTHLQLVSGKVFRFDLKILYVL